jgi:hypothetical protein
MGKSLDNFLTGRNKFSFKVVRVPIVQRERDMKRCPLHDSGRHTKCIGAGCTTFDFKAAKNGEARSDGTDHLVRQEGIEYGASTFKGAQTTLTGGIIRPLAASSGSGSSFCQLWPLRTTLHSCVVCCLFVLSLPPVAAA